MRGILETAVKFARRGSSLQLSLDLGGDSRRVIVETHGLEIAGPALSKFFEIFAIGEPITVDGGDLGLAAPVAYRIAPRAWPFHFGGGPWRKGVRELVESDHRAIRDPFSAIDRGLLSVGEELRPRDLMPVGARFRMDEAERAGCRLFGLIPATVGLVAVSFFRPTRLPFSLGDHGEEASAKSLSLRSKVCASGTGCRSSRRRNC